MNCRLLLALLIGPTAALATVVGPAAHATETAPVDSTTVAEFLGLPPEQVESRRLAAADHARTARGAREGPAQLSHWIRAVELDPSGTSYWLGVVETELEMGYVVDARNSLASARVTIDFLTGEQRKSAIRDYALWVAWWDYEMGRYEKGLAWARRAVEHDAGLPGHLVAGLNFGRITNSWNDLRQENTPFNPLSGGGNRRANVSWSRINYAHENNWPVFTTDEAIYWIEKSKGSYERDLSRWRDYGHWCEVNDSWTLARVYYDKSIESLPIRDGDWIIPGEFRAPNASHQGVTMPFWMNDRGGYLTGSAVAYCAFVHDRMRATPASDERLVLAGNLDLAAERFTSRFPKSPWLRLWRAEALGHLARFDEALKESTVARQKFAKLKVAEPEVDRVQGRLLVAAGKYAKAEPPLVAAIDVFPEDPDLRADLGLVRLRAGDTSLARQLFDEALDLDDGHPVARYQRGLLRWQDGDTEGAMEDIEMAALRAPEREDIAETLSRLEEARESADSQ